MKAVRFAWLVAVTCAAASCGGGSQPTQPAPAAGSGLAATVSIDGDAYRPGGSAVFAPGVITVQSGTVVTWSNKDQTLHNATAVNGSFAGNVEGGGQFSRQFSAVGTFEYRCTIHPSMTGSVVVR